MRPREPGSIDNGRYSFCFSARCMHFLVMRDGHYNLFAVVLLLWCWALGREISTTRRLGVSDRFIVLKTIVD